ncbi:molecular chaperone [Anaeromyxobacter sp. SG17]|uniref:fimbrial biogenesis chaperone n=1 Tax=Anaeromyxobacter sp. SG17 TaxID=2925405 RepID=UPI001F58A112|nr:fimbria/pilus periplasmic chaperone [Anaeromyxobacter sp. SG17]
MRPLLRAARALLVLAALAAGAARAGDLDVTPVNVELSGGARTALMSLRNRGGAPARYQIRAFRWAQKPDGAMDLSPTRELAVFPPLLELGAGEARSLRIGTDAAPAATERTWRIFIEELPQAETAEDAARVKVLTRVGVPVFLAPAARVEHGELAFLGRDGTHVRFALRNPGTVRLRPSAVTLALVAADGARVLERSLEAWYVLAGGERVYEVAVPPEACARAASVVVSAALARGAIEARAPGACRDP